MGTLTLAQIRRVEIYISCSMQVIVNRQDLEDTKNDLLRYIWTLSNCGLITPIDAKSFETYIDMWCDRVDFALKEEEEKEGEKNDLFIPPRG